MRKDEQNDPMVAAVYLRISLDREMDGLAIERQREDCYKIAQDRGWRIYREYVDQSKSATNKAKKREAYDRMVADYHAGAFNAIICWDLDRLTRQPRQLEDWIDAAEEKGLVIVTANGEADLSTDGGKLYARIKAAVARGEVERKGVRQHRAHVQRAEKGIPPTGVRPMGYDRKGQLFPEESEIVRLMYVSFLAGSSLKAIAAALSGKTGPNIPDIPKTPNRMRTLAIERNAIRKENGKPEKPVPEDAPWNPATVLGILRNPRYAGYSTYTPTDEIEGKNRRRTWHAQIMRDEHDEPIMGNWEATVNPDIWWSVQEKLDDPARVSNREGTERKHLGSGLYRCGICGKPIRAHGKTYRCAGHMMRSMRQIDAYVTQAVRYRLAQEDTTELLPSEESPEIQKLSQQIGEAKANIKRVEQYFDQGIIEPHDLKRVRDKERATIEKLEKKKIQLMTNASAASALTADDPVKAFDESDLAQKRSIIDCLCTVTLHPHPRGIKAFDGSDVEIAWK